MMRRSRALARRPLIWDARRLVDRLVRCYNDERLHSAVGHATGKDKLEGREALIFADGKRKSAEARQNLFTLEEGI
jgi:hypothetical protein